jgi:metal-responsive CopG/Arc/MetJ family transcriptional regulator
MGTPKVRVTLYLSSKILKKIDREAAVAKVSRSAFIEAILVKYLNDRKRLGAARKG